MPLLLLVTPGAAQSVFPLPPAATPAEMQETATLVRAIADIDKLNLDAAAHTLSFNGSATQTAFGQWYFSGAPGNFKFSPEGADVARVFHLTSTGERQQLQEIATAVRSTAEIRRLFTVAAGNTIAVRGTPAQIKLSQWLVQELDRPTGPYSSSNEYQLDGDDQDIVRVFFVPAAKTVQDLQELATLVRATAEIKRLFTYNASRAVVVRGAAPQIKLAEWLFAELSKTPAGPLSPEYELAPNTDVVRVFYLSKVDNTKRFQEIATEVRKATAVRRLFTYNAPRAIALRGTSEQIAKARQMLEDKR